MCPFAPAFGLDGASHHKLAHVADGTSVSHHRSTHTQGITALCSWHSCCINGSYKVNRQEVRRRLAAAQPVEPKMHNAMSRTARKSRRPYVALSGTLLMLIAAGHARACDGKSYSLDVATGQIASGGGLQVQLDKIKLLDRTPDKYTISVKDDADVIADHVVLVQYDTLSFKTRCGTVTIGADRKSMFQHGTLTVNWSYF